MEDMRRGRLGKEGKEGKGEEDVDSVGGQVD